MKFRSKQKQEGEEETSFWISYADILSSLLIIILLTSLVSFSQSAIEFIDSESKSPICGIYSTIYKNEDKFENCGSSNKNGIFKMEQLIEQKIL